MRLFLATILALASCHAGAALWPKAVTCGASLGASLLEGLEAVFSRAAGPLSTQDRADLRDLAKAHGAEAVVCGASALADSLRPSAPPPGVAAVTPTPSPALARCEAFLAETGASIQE